MKKDLKLVMVTSLLPVFADFIEDLNEEKAFKRQAKIKTQNIMHQIRSLDEFIMNEASKQAGEEQVNIQIAFRQWVQSAQLTEEN